MGWMQRRANPIIPGADRISILCSELTVLSLFAVRHFVIAHSHGGNIALRAILWSNKPKESHGGCPPLHIASFSVPHIFARPCTRMRVQLNARKSDFFRELVECVRKNQCAALSLRHSGQ
jgi:hypothetical protein